MTKGKVVQERIPDWQLERYLLGELVRDETATVADSLSRQEELVERLAALTRSNADILREHSPARVAASIRSRLVVGSEGAQPSRAPGNRLALALALSVAVAVTGSILAFRRGAPPPAGDVVRHKGSAPHLLLYRNAGPGGVERLEPGTVAHGRDVVQLAYQAGGRRHGVIVSVDGAGLITRHLPATGGLSAPLELGAAVPLPEAFELDDAPGFERFFLVTADEPFPVEAVVAAVRRRYADSGGPPGEGERLELPDTTDQFSFVLRKEPSR
jgi:hypothetical protein